MTIDVSTIKTCGDGILKLADQLEQFGPDQWLEALNAAQELVDSLGGVKCQDDDGHLISDTLMQHITYVVANVHYQKGSPATAACMLRRQYFARRRRARALDFIDAFGFKGASSPN